MEDIFQYPDTNSSKAEIDYLNVNFEGLKIAIIGLGGTGSYILDLVAKTPVSEIHLYDGKTFEVNNAFRAPGAIDGNDFGKPNTAKKVHYFSTVYSKMHKGIKAHDEYVTEHNISKFKAYHYVFVSVDKNVDRVFICKALMDMKVIFLDVGMGINKCEDSLIGTARVTTVTPSKNDHLTERIGSEEVGENLYATNIQVADLNCLNAVLAVIKWKKLIGFYQDLKHEHNSLYFINTGKLLHENLSA